MMRPYFAAVGLTLAMWPVSHVMAEDFWVGMQGSECKVWSDEAQSDKDLITWSGDCKESKASGEGSLV